jgi:hypothetical protein
MIVTFLAFVPGWKKRLRKEPLPHKKTDEKNRNIFGNPSTPLAKLSTTLIHSSQVVVLHWHKLYNFLSHEDTAESVKPDGRVGI